MDGPLEQLVLDGPELLVEGGLQLQLQLLLLIQGRTSVEGKPGEAVVILNQLGEYIPVEILQKEGV